jgi:hypothetical protein
MSNEVGEDIDTVPNLYQPVGIIPATECTPDIIFPDDRSSEKVAVLSFLTLWFMPKAIQGLVKQRASLIICGLSPLSGGNKIENSLATSGKVFNITSLSEYFDLSSKASKYSGACKYPKWGKDGRMLKKGHLAIYATSIKEDLEHGYTERQNDKLRRSMQDFEKQEDDDRYKFASDRLVKGLCLSNIFEAYNLDSDYRDSQLARIFADEFSDIQSLFDMVPKRLAHEVAHLLERGSGLYPHEFIQQEVEEKVPRKNSMLSHYRKPSEAVAELAGIALLRHVQSNAGLGYGIPTTMLDKLLPDSYYYVEKQIDLLCTIGIPRGAMRTLNRN